MKKKLFLRFSVTIFCLIASLTLDVLAQDPAATENKEEPSFQSLFQEGIKYYQEKKFTEAKGIFQKAIELNPKNVQVITNLGLTYFQTGEKGYALALMRKAHSLDPDFSTPISAIEFIQSQLTVKEIPHEINSWETLRAQFIQPFSQFSFVVLSALFLFAAGWTWIQFFSQRKKAAEEEKPYPQIPLLGIIYSVCFTILFALMLAKFYDHFQVRGTIVAEKTSVLSLPNEKAPTLFELYSGLEVLVLKKETDWLQVRYPGGMIGWIKNNDLFITHGSLNE